MAADFSGTKLDVGNRIDDDFRCFDLGFLTGVGYAFNDSIDLGLAAEFGFLNADPD